MRIKQISFFMLAICLLASCITPNEMAMQIGASPESDERVTVDLRALQTRYFESLDEKRLLHAATQSLQDLGFTISESSVEAGVLVGSKKRNAEEAGQVAGQVALTVVLALFGSATSPTWDQEQDIFVSLVISPIKNSQKSAVRVLFDRRITNNHGIVWRSELIVESEIYQEFFDKLSQGVFLEAEQI